MSLLWHGCISEILEDHTNYKVHSLNNVFPTVKTENVLLVDKEHRQLKMLELSKQKYLFYLWKASSDLQYVGVKGMFCLQTDELTLETLVSWHLCEVILPAE